MRTRLTLSPPSPAEADTAFEQHLQGSLYEFLRNECVLSESGVQRVMVALREIYVTGIHAMYVKVEINTDEDLSAYDSHKEIIAQYCRQVAPGIINTISTAASTATFNIMKSTAKHLATLDDQANRRRLN